jgi:hypothetical protein
MLTPELLEALRAPEGAELLARAAALADDPFAAEKLRREAAPELAAAAVEQVRLRRRAAGKLDRAAELWLAPSLLEQASGDVTARHRARRFRQWHQVADLCCGLGVDALALAAHARVTAVDREPLALALTAANAEVCGLRERIEVRRGEVPADAPEVPAAWVDPGRREGGTRTRRLGSMSPTLAEALSLRNWIGSLGIKLSPASADVELDTELRGIPHEREFLSVGGECRELAVWLGELAEAGVSRRATVLSADGAVEELAGDPRPYQEVRAPGSWLLEPDAAVIRAGLVGNLAERLGAWAVDERLAYLSADAVPETRLARAYRIQAPEPFSLKALAARLRGLDAGDVVLKTRGTAATPEVLRQQLRRVLKQGRPQCRPVVFVTRLGDRPMMILGERVGPGAEQLDQSR